MNNSKTLENASSSYYDVAKVFKILSDPIKLGIIFELIRRPDLSTLEIKKKLNLPGSGIYYYLNQLIENKIIEEAGVENLTSHLSRRRFKITEWFKKVISDLKYDKKRGHRKAAHLFQLQFAIMTLERQLRV
ncbi:MAG: winged helix-turn-helix transcriptional regulator, partial [Candidatus Hodarchaeales archaeon]